MSSVKLRGFVGHIAAAGRRRPAIHPRCRASCPCFPYVRGEADEAQPGTNQRPLLLRFRLKGVDQRHQMTFSENTHFFPSLGEFFPCEKNAARLSAPASSWREASRMSSESACPLVLLEPGFPPDSAGGLLGAGIASLTQSPDHFARQPERDDGPRHSPLLEPDAR